MVNGGTEVIGCPPCEMGIEGSTSGAFVAEDFLYEPQVHAILQQVGGEGMPKGVD